MFFYKKWDLMSTAVSYFGTPVSLLFLKL